MYFISFKILIFLYNIVLMDFEDLTTTTLKTTWIEIAAIVLTVFLLVTNIQIPLLTRLMDTIYGKLFGFLLIIYLLSEEQYRLAIALAFILINVLSVNRERDDLLTLRNKLQKSSVEKNKIQAKISGPTKKCSRENRVIEKKDEFQPGFNL
jgi:hypothetical protein